MLEDYRKKLPPQNTELREALGRAIVAIRSRLFQALLGRIIMKGLNRIPSGRNGTELTNPIAKILVTGIRLLLGGHLCSGTTTKKKKGWRVGHIKSG